MLKLHIGKRFTGVTVHEDGNWPGMWRVHHDGYVSDMVNLTRAKDAALTHALQGRGVLRKGEVVRWDTGETGLRASPIRPIDGASVTLAPSQNEALQAERTPV